MLGEVEETIYTVDEEDEGGNGEVRTVKKQSEMLFVRGKLPCCAVLFWTLSSREGGVEFGCILLTICIHRRLCGPHFTSAITTFVINNGRRYHEPVEALGQQSWREQLMDCRHD